MKNCATLTQQFWNNFDAESVQQKLGSLKGEPRVPPFFSFSGRPSWREETKQTGFSFVNNVYAHQISTHLIKDLESRDDRK